MTEPEPERRIVRGEDTVTALDDAHVDEVNVGTTDPRVTEQPEVTIRRLDERQEDTRKALAIGLSVATFLVGLIYLLVPLWAGTDKWDRASSPFQVVFTAMVGLTGSAIGYYFSSRNPPS
ncbi:MULTISPECIES: hypothetical protein [Rhodococcus]|uniref:Uncharacterized protein n=1 Tax=Rhodococcus opacus RKJ300 = JCM 13270 TaxID=1165867 RepID=I0WPF3_RHOOP|nr:MULTISPECIES: hypothetical protein [Rhodococcus]EID78269.1 hypothetical protein W59_19548 [Rhodococcus opacus RKJ300 = JCM 13270]KAF0961830.1 hypothetical protein MLGJGCBP_05056 [Rhodococcus sp. T7]UOT08191.1 hypothetical protein MPY17_38240 [Rhodococcus opacus]